ncbi:MAG: CHAD domain-containing protein [Chthoniobacteraceae bacterium]
MAFELHPREPLGHGIARVFRREARKAGKSGRAGDIPKIVHELRQRMKKMRAILRLVRAETGGDRYQLENQRLREIGRQLSEMRDAEVRLRTFERILERNFDDERLFRSLHHELAERARYCTKAAGEILEETIFHEPEPLPLDRLTSPKLCEALLKTYRRARKALRVAQEKPTTEALHTLRKRTKDLWYDLRLLQRAFPEVLKPQAAQFKRLSILLGEYLDLALLLAAIPKNAPELKPLVAAVKARQLRLKRASLDYADLCLAEKPKKFATRVAAYFPGNRCGAAA